MFDEFENVDVPAVAIDDYQPHLLSDDRPFPSDIAAEDAVIGAIVLSGRATYDDAAEYLSENDFYSPLNRCVWQAFGLIAAAGAEIDLISICDTLERRSLLEQAGGRLRLAQMLTSNVSTANITNMANVVRDRSIRRQHIALARELEDRAWDLGTSVIETATDIDKELIESAGLDAANLRYVHASDAVIETLDVISEHSKPEHERSSMPVHIGLAGIDAIIPELVGGDLVILAARPGVGKSALMLSSICSTLHKHSHAIFSLEMARVQLTMRLMAMREQISLAALRTAKLKVGELDGLRRAGAWLRGAPLWIDDTTTHIAGIRARARKMVQRDGVQAIWIDYLQLIENGRQTSNMSRENVVSDISRQLKLLARSLKVPVIVLAQLNRAAGEGQPKLHHLRESGAIEQDADIVGLLWRGSDDIAQLDIAKQRNGATGFCKLKWLKEYTRFADLAPEPGTGSAAELAEKHKQQEQKDLF